MKYKYPQDRCYYCGGPYESELRATYAKHKPMCDRCWLVPGFVKLVTTAVKKGGRSTHLGGRLIIDMPKKKRSK